LNVSFLGKDSKRLANKLQPRPECPLARAKVRQVRLPHPLLFKDNGTPGRISEDAFLSLSTSGLLLKLLLSSGLVRRLLKSDIT
jgi:hypothetical protein